MSDNEHRALLLNQLEGLVAQYEEVLELANVQLRQSLEPDHVDWLRSVCTGLRASLIHMRCLCRRVPDIDDATELQFVVGELQSRVSEVMDR